MNIILNLSYINNIYKYNLSKLLAVHFGNWQLTVNSLFPKNKLVTLDIYSDNYQRPMTSEGKTRIRHVSFVTKPCLISPAPDPAAPQLRYMCLLIF